LFTALGFFISSLIPASVKIRTKRIIFVAVPLITSISALYLATYHPELFPPMHIEGKGLTFFKIYSEHLIIILFALSVLMFIREYNKTKNKMVLLLCVS